MSDTTRAKKIIDAIRSANDCIIESEAHGTLSLHLDSATGSEVARLCGALPDELSAGGVSFYSATIEETGPSGLGCRVVILYDKEADR